MYQFRPPVKSQELKVVDSRRELGRLPEEEVLREKRERSCRVSDRRGEWSEERGSSRGNDQGGTPRRTSGEEKRLCEWIITH